MELTYDEKQMLAGAKGEAIRKAIELQVEIGDFFGAEKFVPINNAHMMGDIEVMGDGGFNFLKNMVNLNAHCAVNTTTNARCFDFPNVKKLGQDEVIAEKEKELIAMLQSMGVMTTDTCINYQSLYQPHLGEHVAWGDTGTVIYANSILGARSNFESGPAAYAAAITGRVPAYGFHLDEHRKGKVLVNVEADLNDFADWGVIGKIVGEKHQNYLTVPVFAGIKRSPSSDELKHIGASLASYGSMGMYHMVGVTPEANTIEQAFGGNEPIDVMTITNEDIKEVYAKYNLGDRNANLVVFSGPQLSLFEMKMVSELLDGKKIKEGTSLIITTNSGIKTQCEQLGYAQKIYEAGGQILEGVCFYILYGVAQMRIDNGWTNLITNSAKLANIVGAHKFNPILRRTEECVNIAITGGLE